MTKVKPPNHQHVSNGEMYLTTPAQYKCKVCGEFYVEPPKDYIDESGYIDPKDLENVTLPKPVKGKIEFQSTPPKDELKQLITSSEFQDYLYSDPDVCVDAIEEIIKLKQEALLNRVEKEVIGEDEYLEITEETWREFQKTAPHPFNDLRAEQRQAINKIREGL